MAVGENKKEAGAIGKALAAAEGAAAPAGGEPANAAALADVSDKFSQYLVAVQALDGSL
jgi:hypothetical protein